MDLLTQHAESNGDHAAVIVDASGGAHPSATTFAELEADANRLGRALQSLGAQRGDRVAWCGPNSLPVITTLHATRKVGATSVPVSYRFNAAEMQYVIDNADATVVLVDAEQAPLVASVRDQLPKVRAVLVFGGGAPPGCVHWDDVVAPQEPAPPEVSEAGGGTAGATMIYTAGTTGKPKDAVRTGSEGP